jgi:hypothetical protein
MGRVSDGDGLKIHTGEIRMRSKGILIVCAMFVAYPVVDVSKTLKDNETLYIITYVIPEGVDYKFSFYYSPQDGGTIRYKNQKYLVWKKAKGSIEAGAPIGR